MGETLQSPTTELGEIIEKELQLGARESATLTKELVESKDSLIQIGREIRSAVWKQMLASFTFNPIGTRLGQYDLTIWVGSSKDLDKAREIVAKTRLVQQDCIRYGTFIKVNVIFNIQVTD